MIYADDTGSAGHFGEIEVFFKDLAKIGPDFGYFPEPSKSVLIVRYPNLLAALVFFNDQCRRGFQITTGHRYIGIFIGEVKKRDEWISSRFLDFEHELGNWQALPNGGTIEHESSLTEHSTYTMN